MAYLKKRTITGRSYGLSEIKSDNLVSEELHNRISSGHMKTVMKSRSIGILEGSSRHVADNCHYLKGIGGRRVHKDSSDIFGQPGLVFIRSCHFSICICWRAALITPRRVVIKRH